VPYPAIWVFVSEKEAALIRSTNQELGEYDLIREPTHITTVWSIVEAALPVYWDGFVQRERQRTPAAQFAARFGKPITVKDETDSAVLARVFGAAISSYEKDAQKYRQFFDREAMEEFLDDPNAFKQSLSRDVAVIANSLRSRRSELREWQRHFRGARSKDLLEVFSNVLDFIEDWQKTHPKNRYANIDEPDAFGLDPLDNDESMSLVNVIGMGIKSIVLYHLDPERLPQRGRNSLYGLYFLSGRGHFDLPSESSEFLMINDINPRPDGSIIMDQNYWYPYGLFSLYVLRISKWMERRSSDAGFTLDHSMRYVYVERFLESVCNKHSDDLKTMRAHESFEIPW
jgi:hypothetical protein